MASGRHLAPSLAPPGSGWLRLLSALALVAILATSLAGSASAQGREDFPVEGGWFYTQTRGGQPAGYGYAVVDIAGVPMWTAFRELGGVDRLGYPISHRFIWDGFPAQAFEGGVLHWRADVGVVQIVNVLDWLGQQGFDNWLAATYGAAPSLDWRDDVLYNWEFVKARHFALLDGSPRIREAYFGIGADPVTYYGLPQSAVNNGQTFVVRTQRAIFQEWRQDVPWARAGTVFVIDGGEILKEAGIIPANAQAPLLPGPALSLAGFPPVAVIQPQPRGTGVRAPAPPPDALCPPYAPVQPYRPNCRILYGFPPGAPVPPGGVPATDVPPARPAAPPPAISAAPIAPAPAGPIAPAPPPAYGPAPAPPFGGPFAFPGFGGSCTGDETVEFVPNPAIADREFSVEVSSAKYTLGVGLWGPGSIRLREVVAGGKGTVWKFAVIAPAGTWQYTFVRDGGASACVTRTVEVVRQ
ncbi:MAG: hypothetical protein KatS3mg060_1343 [Dehalococcoidia bacterium]|nr:MAG: hypothetical protein KatS3mg060_1343 [Dehalococcoidia bacterium]